MLNWAIRSVSSIPRFLSKYSGVDRIKLDRTKDITYAGFFFFVNIPENESKKEKFLYWHF